jgi:acyl-[acyl-carrier-protein] desaturase
MGRIEDQALLSELQPTMETLLDRHLAASKEWFPHEFVPWGRGRDFEEGETFDPSEFPLPDGVRSALFVNLLTEDNLPYYSRTIERVFYEEAWREWTRRWTAEEQRHSIVIRDYLTVVRAIDPVALERARMSQVSGGVVPEPQSVADALVYLTFQELATLVAHRNTGRALEDRAGTRMMARVASDEGLHHKFYRDLAAAAIELAPSEMMAAIERQVLAFQMPGIGIAEFNKHARAIAKAGIYDFSLHHDQVLDPVLSRAWAITELTGLDDRAEVARDKVLRHAERVAAAGRRSMARREEQQAAELALRS